MTLFRVRVRAASGEWLLKNDIESRGLSHALTEATDMIRGLIGSPTIMKITVMDPCRPAELYLKAKGTICPWPAQEDTITDEEDDDDCVRRSEEAEA